MSVLYPCTCSFIHRFTHSSTQSFTHSFVRPLIPSSWRRPSSPEAGTRSFLISCASSAHGTLQKTGPDISPFIEHLLSRLQLSHLGVCSLAPNPNLHGSLCLGERSRRRLLTSGSAAASAPPASASGPSADAGVW